MFLDQRSDTSKIMRGFSSADAHYYGIFHNRGKDKNSHKFNFDAPIDFKTSPKEDIDMENDPCNFFQNLTS